MAAPVLISTLLVALALFCTATMSWAKHSVNSSKSTRIFAEEEESEGGPPDDVIKKLGAMSPDQKFERGEEIKSDGKHAPKDAPVYPVDIQDATGKSVLKLFFFKGENGKWSVYDEAGNVMHET